MKREQTKIIKLHKILNVLNDTFYAFETYFPYEGNKLTANDFYLQTYFTVVSPRSGVLGEQIVVYPSPDKELCIIQMNQQEAFLTNAYTSHWSGRKCVFAD